MIRRRALAAVAAGAIGLGLVACTPDLPELAPDPESATIEPVLDDPRLTVVLQDIAAHLERADAASDIDLLRERVENPALRVRQAEYQLQAATDGEASPQSLTTQSQVAIVATTDEWPRTVLVVTQIPDGANLPLLIGLRQDAPRDPYRLFSWVRLLPGVTMPPTEVPEVGSSPVDPDDGSFLLSPTEALEQYADVLTEFDDSEFAGNFAEDAYRELVQAEATNVAEELSAAGEFSHNTVVRDDVPVAMRTADGGVVVVGSLRTRHTYTKDEPEGEMEVGGQLAALSDNGGEVDERTRATFVVMVALYIPPDNEEAQVTVLGAERVLAILEEE